MPKPTVLIIMDGFGLSPETRGNAIAAQGTPGLDALKQVYPHTQISASGLDVGLPDGQMGNSEVGHLNIGAGRVVYQDITRIDKAIDDGDFFGVSEFTDAIKTAAERGKRLHLMGLLSDGGVHSSLKHLFALIEAAKRRNFPGDRLFIHCFTDGRDVSPTSGAGFIRTLEEYLEKVGKSMGGAGKPYGRIATVMGRYYAMDRDNRWDRVAEAFNCMTARTGTHTQTPSAAAYVESNYPRERMPRRESDRTDEFILPAQVVDEKNQPIGLIGDGDSVIFYNFRSDRAREISQAFLYADFDKFTRASGYIDVHYTGMTQYDETFKTIHTAFKPQSMKNTLGEYVASLHKKQLRIAETEKYAHVTFFFNGGAERPNPGEDRALIPSPKVATYDLQPEMSAREVTERVIAEIRKNVYDLIVLNFANCDMVGHTGITDAAQKAVGVVDECVSLVVRAVLSAGGAALITADHGNAERMVQPDGSPNTAHTTNPVPFILAGDAFRGARLRDGGRLCDLAPTILHVMGLAVPAEMTGQSLIVGRT
ncbi:2,3-bisphosphoglycerate-independent phosphoglycerate mutase [Clostridia bacterium]|nr:2,3-bisphosphoglycerate-independent phosphoglycerate mutase [Clostridia bacterium]